MKNTTISDAMVRALALVTAYNETHVTQAEGRFALGLVVNEFGVHSAEASEYHNHSLNELHRIVKKEGKVPEAWRDLHLPMNAVPHAQGDAAAALARSIVFGLKGEAAIVSAVTDMTPLEAAFFALEVAAYLPDMSEIRLRKSLRLALKPAIETANAR